MVTGGNRSNACEPAALLFETADRPFQRTSHPVIGCSINDMALTGSAICLLRGYVAIAVGKDATSAVTLLASGPRRESDQHAQLTRGRGVCYWPEADT